MSTSRVFVGVPAGAAVAERIGAVRSGFWGGAVRWVPAENLHLTLKFLGDVADAQVGAVRSALREALADSAGFSVAARGLGVFPDSRRPRVLWVGLEAPELARMAGRVEQALVPLGVERAATPFRPHVTIGRWRRPEPGGAGLGEELTRWRDQEFGAFRVEAVTLFRSTLRPAGAEYTALEVFPLRGAASPPAAAGRPGQVAAGNP